MKINDVMHIEDIIPDLLAETKDGVLAELAARLAERHPVLDPAEVLRILQERERLGSTGIGDGIAIPHGKIRNLQKLALIVGRSRNGVDFNALDGRPTYLFFLLAAPEEAVGLHLKMLARISRIMKEPAIRNGIRKADDAAAIFTIIHDRDRCY